MSAVAEKAALRQYLTFRLDSASFAVDVLQAREVLDRVPITRVPQMPEFVLGVINLRGTVVPVIDLRAKFSLPVSEGAQETCIVVLEVDLDGQETVVGALADSVEEVMELDTNQIEPPPRLGNGTKVNFIRGLGKKDGEFQIILDIQKLFSDGELTVLGDLIMEKEAMSA